MQPHALAARPQGLMIDLDGTLVNTLGDFTLALNGMLADLGLAPITESDIKPLVGKGSEHLLESVLRLSLPQASDAERAALQAPAWRSYQTHYQACNGRAAALYPGVKAGLDALAALGLPLACLTNKPTGFAKDLLQQLQIAPYFAQVFGGDAFARKKPDPLPLLETSKALGLPIAEVWMVGDSSNDAEAARAAGAPVVLVTYGYNHGQPIRAVDADLFIDSLEELPQHWQ